MNCSRHHVWVSLVCAAMVAGCGASAHRTDASIARAAAVSGDEMYRFAVTLAARGDLVRAEQYAALAVTQGFPLQRALPLLVAVCLRASRVSAALAHAELGLSQQPDNVHLRYLVASMYVALNQPVDATRALERVLIAAPTHAPAAGLMAELHGSTR